MLSPFYGAMLHPDPNAIPGNPLKDICILLLTHTSRSEFIRVFRTTKATVPVHKTGDRQSISVRGTMPLVPSRPGLVHERGAGLRMLGTDHRAHFHSSFQK